MGSTARVGLDTVRELHLGQSQMIRQIPWLRVFVEGVVIVR